mmetsp:Transcript_9087/g.14742  ORF Transcript_9087/g.14742 Transcript_9087/m.14742 type:complete len:455 (-) Transcript_9087:27-1391(-)
MEGRGQLSPLVLDLLRRAARITQSLDEEGSGVLPVQCWRILLHELGVTEESEASNILMDFVEPCSQGHFTYKPLLDALQSAPGRRDEPRGYLDGPGPGPSPDGAACSIGSPAPWQSPGKDRRQSPPVPGLALGKVDPEESEGASRGYPAANPVPMVPYVSDGPNDGAIPTPDAVSPPLREEQLREHQASLQAAEPMEVVNEAFWQRRGPAIQRLYCQWDCNQLTNQTFQAQMQQVLGASVDIRHPESEFLRLINKHLSARTMKFASMMSGLRRDAHSTARRGGLSSGVSVWSAYEPSEAGSEATSAAGKPTNPMAQPHSRGGRRHFQLPSENHVLPGSGKMRGLVDVPEDDVPEDLDAEKPQDDLDIFGRKIGKPMPRRHDRVETASIASGASGISEADIQREAFSARNRSGHGNILAWDDGSRPLTPPKVREGRHVAVDQQGMPRLHMSSGIF